MNPIDKPETSTPMGAPVRPVPTPPPAPDPQWVPASTPGYEKRGNTVRKKEV